MLILFICREQNELADSADCIATRYIQESYVTEHNTHPDLLINAILSYLWNYDDVTDSVVQWSAARTVASNRALRRNGEYEGSGPNEWLLRCTSRERDGVYPCRLTTSALQFRTPTQFFRLASDVWQLVRTSVIAYYEIAESSSSRLCVTIVFHYCALGYLCRGERRKALREWNARFCS